MCIGSEIGLVESVSVMAVLYCDWRWSLGTVRFDCENSEIDKCIHITDSFTNIKQIFFLCTKGMDTEGFLTGLMAYIFSFFSFYFFCPAYCCATAVNRLLAAK